MVNLGNPSSEDIDYMPQQARRWTEMATIEVHYLDNLLGTVRAALSTFALLVALATTILWLASYSLEVTLLGCRLAELLGLMLLNVS